MKKRTRIKKKKLDSYTIIEGWLFPLFVVGVFSSILVVMFLSILFG